jgi:phosphoserine phosphatase RsbU/P
MTTAGQMDCRNQLSVYEQLLSDQREANARMVNATICAQEMAERAEAALARAEASERKLLEMVAFRDLFIGILGHDLRNPLTAVQVTADRMLLGGQLNGDDEQGATRIILRCKRMFRMIAQLLDLTRARLDGGLPLETKPTDLRELCREIVEDFDIGKLRLEVEGDVSGVWDPDRLVEVLSNIAGNAIEHAVPGTAVAIEARADGAAVVVEIRNQGAPIAEDVLPFIFEPFRQAEALRKSKSGNLGLGLFIAYEIVRAHGGTLDARSHAGTTTFTLRLPRRPKNE